MALIFKTEGFEALNEQLIALSRDIRSNSEFNRFRRVMTKSVEAALEPVYRDVQSEAPYDEKNTGPIHLRNTARVNVRMPTAKDKSSHYVNESDAIIGVVSVKKSAVSLSQEFGNSRTPAHPFLRKSLERNVDKSIGILKSELSVRIPEYVKSLSKRKI